MFFLIKLYLSAIPLQVPSSRAEEEKKKNQTNLSKVINKNNNNFALFLSEIFPQSFIATSVPAPAETRVQF